MKKGIILATALASLMVGSIAMAAPKTASHKACTTQKVCAKAEHQACTKGAHHAMYTCPMHSKVKMDKPGKCPECGMNLTMVKQEECQKTMTPVKCKEHCK